MLNLIYRYNNFLNWMSYKINYAISVSITTFIIVFWFHPNWSAGIVVSPYMEILLAFSSVTISLASLALFDVFQDTTPKF
jgi:hypothetical protein